MEEANRTGSTEEVEKLTSILEKKPSELEIKAHTTYNGIKSGWNNFVSFPLSVSANIAVIEILVLEIFPSLKVLPAIPLGALCVGLVFGLCYWLNKRSERIPRKRDDFIG